MLRTPILDSVYSGHTAEMLHQHDTVTSIVIGFALYFWLKKRNEVKEEESSSTVDGETVETEIVEPQYRQMNY